MDEMRVSRKAAATDQEEFPQPSSCKTKASNLVKCFALPIRSHKMPYAAAMQSEHVIFNRTSITLAKSVGIMAHGRTGAKRTTNRKFSFRSFTTLNLE